MFIGIDLGTTNCTLSYQASESKKIERFAIPQVSSVGYQESLPSLPSFIYLPFEQEISSGSLAPSWNKQARLCVGALALKKSAELPQQVIASAKSWLCFQGEEEPSLPWKSEAEGKLSPKQALTTLLTHMKDAWNEEKQDSPFEEQRLCITVPASFDPKAREIIQNAAEEAQCPTPLLLEEPQAAFYAWLNEHEDSWRKQLQVGDTVLIIDIGGGTTDFSLIQVQEESGDLKLERKAVGSHLLLGGDNMDLALAAYIQRKLKSEGTRLDHWQFQHLVHQCKSAKEQLLSKTPPESISINIESKSSSLIGGSIQATLTTEEIQNLLLDGFFPLLSPEEQAQNRHGVGLQQVGLPYCTDARITAHLAKFLSRTGESEETSLAHFQLPTHILCNGGILKGEGIRERLMEVFNLWAEELNQSAPSILEEADLDHAVSLGAAYYLKAKEGSGIRIRAGSSHSYFIGIEQAMPAIPGFPPPIHALCVVPFGMEEGSELPIPGEHFHLSLNTPTTFRFFRRSTEELPSGQTPQVGDYVEDWEEDLEELPPLEITLQSEHGASSEAVTLASHLTELGVLEIWCTSSEGQKWKFQFDAREKQDALQPA